MPPRKIRQAQKYRLGWDILVPWRVFLCGAVVLWRKIWPEICGATCSYYNFRIKTWSCLFLVGNCSQAWWKKHRYWMLTFWNVGLILVITCPLFSGLTPLRDEEVVRIHQETSEDNWTGKETSISSQSWPCALTCHALDCSLIPAEPLIHPKIDMEQAKSPQDETGSCLPNFFEVPPTRNKALGTTAPLQQKKTVQPVSLGRVCCASGRSETSFSNFRGTMLETWFYMVEVSNTLIKTHHQQ